MLKGKKILLGITASIAAYKAATIIRLLVKEGAEVQVIMTPPSKEFITPVTLSALSGNPVLSDFFSGGDGRWNSHVELGLWADIFLVAPVTASSIGKMVNGIADNLLLATYLSCKCPIFIAPAMDLDMFAHPSTSRNIEILKSYGNQVIEPGTGELASGLYGKGRMEEPEVILNILQQSLATTSSTGKKKKAARLRGHKILINAGPTHESIDPVRYIGNHSTGKMGFAIAEAVAAEGAQVILVAGPTSLSTTHPSIIRIDVTTAAEMASACIEQFVNCHVGIMTAAVADYTPREKSGQKLKSSSESLTIELEPTIDIAAELGKRKTGKQVLVGFALETENEKGNAQKKINKKNLDFIVLNSLRDKGAGFAYDTNKISIIDADNNVDDFELKSKADVALDILNKLIEYI